MPRTRRVWTDEDLAQELTDAIATLQSIPHKYLRRMERFMLLYAQGVRANFAQLQDMDALRFQQGREHTAQQFAAEFRSILDGEREEESEPGPERFDDDE